MGVSLTVAQIVAPLRNGRLIGMALLANFVVVPAVAYALTRLIPLSQPLQIGVLLVGTAAGAPFLPKLAQIARADIAFPVGADGGDRHLPAHCAAAAAAGRPGRGRQIAVSLLVTMLLPLAVGLLVRARWPDSAESVQPVLAQVANISLVLPIVATVAVDFSSLIGLVGSGGILAILLLVIISLGAGYLLGGPSADSRSVLGLGSGQRNLAAALIVATSNLTDPNVLVTVAAAGALGMLVLFPVASELGKRASLPQTAAPPSIGVRAGR